MYFIEPNIPKILLFQHIINIKIINEIFYTLLFALSLQNLGCTAHLSLGLTALQVLKRSMCPVATVSDSTELDKSYTVFCPMA